MIKRLNKKFLFIISCFVVLITITSVITWAVRSTPTEPVSSIMFQSDDFDSPGSWKVQKSAKWTGRDTATITFDLSTIPQLDGRNKDIVFIMDCSQGYFNLDFDVEKENISDLLDYIFENQNNRVAIIGYNSTSEIISNFTNDKNSLKNSISEMDHYGNTSYSSALLSLETLLENYEYSNDRDLNVVFFTYRYPNADSNARNAIYERIKLKYPYIHINGVQLRLDLHAPFVDVTDKQWLATDDTLYAYLLQAALDATKYENFVVEDYIDSSNFEVLNDSDIEANLGNVSLVEDNGVQKVVWNMDNVITSSDSAKMTINIKFKSNLLEVAGLYYTNEREVITSKLVGDTLKTKESDSSPILKNYYQVIYDTNLPSGCSIANIPTQNHAIYTNVTKLQDTLSCSGYTFNGWQIVESDVKRVNDDVFVMPEHDVNLKAIWSKPSISKSMDGTIHEKNTLYKKIKSDYITGNYAHIYEGEDSENYDKNVYFYDVSTPVSFDNIENNVKFADYCWRMFRTTDTGGVKLLYNGEPDNGGKCGTNRGYHVGYNGYSVKSLASDYYYGTNYTYDENTHNFQLSGDISHGSWNDSTYENFVGKYTCMSYTTDATCSTLYYVDEYNSSSSGNCFSLSGYTQYGYLGYIQNLAINSPAYAGYMYNTIYPTEKEYMTFFVTRLLNDRTLTLNYYVSNSFSVDGTKVSLVNPSLPSTASDMVGKYTVFSSESNGTSSYYVYYITGVDDDNLYYLIINYNKNLNDVNNSYYFSDNIRDNGDNTYTLSGNVVEVKSDEWVDDHQNIENKYTCANGTQTCSSPYYVTSTTKTSFTYYSFERNFKYGNSFTYNYNTGMYTLVDTVQFYNFHDRYHDLGTHHYTCFNSSGTCSTIAYVTNYEESPRTSDYNNLTYISISDGKGIEDAIAEMLHNNDVNTKSSTIKKAADLWYSKYLLDYDDYIEDTVYCNDRKIYRLGEWDPDGGFIEYTYNGTEYVGFLEFDKNELKNRNAYMPEDFSLSCPYNNDKFTVSNDIGNGKLTYPIGYMTYDEIKLFEYGTNDYATFNSMTPGYFTVDYMNDLLKGSIFNQNVRPVISLKADIEYLSGDGSTDFPFVITE